MAAVRKWDAVDDRFPGQDDERSVSGERGVASLRPQDVLEVNRGPVASFGEAGGFLEEKGEGGTERVAVVHRHPTAPSLRGAPA